MKKLTSCRDRCRGGFTFVELFCVMAIMAILLAVTVPSIEGLNLSAGIGQGGQTFTDQVALARQLASARNVTVEMRCILIPARSTVGYTGIQLWSPVTGAPLSRVITMPDGIALSQDITTISKLFSTYKQPTPLSTMPAGSPVQGDSYVSFTISPSGLIGPLSTTATAPDMKATSVGITPSVRAADTTLPKNFVLVQLNPLTAATTIYRP